VNADPDPTLKMNADPCGADPGYSVKTKILSQSKIMLNFNENKVTINILTNCMDLYTFYA
jgi:hypothetical protein